MEPLARKTVDRQFEEPGAR